MLTTIININITIPLCAKLFWMISRRAYEINITLYENSCIKYVLTNILNQLHEFPPITDRKQ